MAKIRISATIDKETDRILDELMKNGNYRNKSHLIESLIKSAKEQDDKNKK
jgi:Arc/MetJ-type ribon-helix-helix transcriptional regulator